MLDERQECTTGKVQNYELLPLYWLMLINRIVSPNICNNMIYFWKYYLSHYWNIQITYYMFNWRPKLKSLVTFFIRSNKKTRVYLTYFEKALKILFLFFDVILINKFLIMEFSGWEGSNKPCLFSYDFNHKIRSLLFPRIHCYYDANVS